MATSNPIYGNSSIVDLLLGNKEVKKIYVGSVLIYNSSDKPAASAPQISFFYETSNLVVIDKDDNSFYNLYIDDEYAGTVE